MDNTTEKRVVAYSDIPYNIINMELGSQASSFKEEISEILDFYKVYKKGAEFTTEGSHKDYVPASLKYKMASSLINKEARFLFAESPEIAVENNSNQEITDEENVKLSQINTMLQNILVENNFDDKILKAAKDCFIGKRVACVVNFNETDGISITFLPSTEFIYETQKNNSNNLVKFVALVKINNVTTAKEKRFFKKKYEVVDNVVYLEEHVYNGSGDIVETLTERQKTTLTQIPVTIFINDGLTGEASGESEIEALKSYEEWYSKLSNADMDAERKSMNPTKYLVDMAENSTKDLSSSAGAIWDLGSDQNIEKPSVQIGMLEPQMNYSTALKTSLERIKTTGYEQIDMPNITLDSMHGTITSGKSLKAIYWPLIVRCKEKMKTWEPGIKKIMNTIIKGAILFPSTASRYTKGQNVDIEELDYKIIVRTKNPLPEDEIEERNMDISEVEAKVMSKKSYMKKWQGLTDVQAEAELEQIALERQIIEDSAFPV